MSTTFKAVVYAHHRKEDGTYNVKIRVTHNRKRKHLPTSIFVTKEDLTRGLKIKNAQVNDTLKRSIESYQKIVATLPIERANVMSVEQIVDYLQNYNKNNGVFELDFIAFGRQVVEETRAAGRVGTARSYETTLNSLVRYLKRDTLSIHEVTPAESGLTSTACCGLKRTIRTTWRKSIKYFRSRSAYCGSIIRNNLKIFLLS